MSGRGRSPARVFFATAKKRGKCENRSGFTHQIAKQFPIPRPRMRNAKSCARMAYAQPGRAELHTRPHAHAQRFRDLNHITDAFISNEKASNSRVYKEKVGTYLRSEFDMYTMIVAPNSLLFRHRRLFVRSKYKYARRWASPANGRKARPFVGVRYMLLLKVGRPSRAQLRCVLLRKMAKPPLTAAT